jgi:hypothetical protein
MTPYWALCGLLERYVHLKTQNSGRSTDGEPVTYEPSMAERFPLTAHILPGRKA